MPGDRDRPNAPRRPSSRGRGPGPRVWGLVLTLSACACPPAPATPSQSPESDTPPPAAALREPGEAVRTANPDRRGFDNQPDYDGEAAALREYVDGRLLAPLAGDRGAACAAMFAAVDAFYAAVEYGSEARQREVAQALAQSREGDLAACARETSPKAAACVTVLLGDRTAEFPWLLDQCSRAYPAA